MWSWPGITVAALKSVCNDICLGDRFRRCIGGNGNGGDLAVAGHQMLSGAADSPGGHRRQECA